jgi:hypothetical protein
MQSCVVNVVLCAWSVHLQIWFLQRGGGAPYNVAVFFFLIIEFIILVLRLKKFIDFITTIDFIISFLDFIIMAAEDRLSKAEPQILW